MKNYKDSNNNIYAYEEDGSQDHLIGNKIKITQEEANLIIQAKQEKRHAALGYAEKRTMEYKPIAEQLDMQYHDVQDGTETWLDHIKEVKAKYPKGDE